MPFHVYQFDQNYNQVFKLLDVYAHLLNKCCLSGANSLKLCWKSISAPQFHSSSQTLSLTWEIRESREWVVCGPRKMCQVKAWCQFCFSHSGHAYLVKCLPSPLHGPLGAQISGYTPEHRDVPRYQGIPGFRGIPRYRGILRCLGTPRYRGIPRDHHHLLPVLRSHYHGNSYIREGGGCIGAGCGAYNLGTIICVMRQQIIFPRGRNRCPWISRSTHGIRPHPGIPWV
jgi:hypothetical protein